MASNRIRTSALRDFSGGLNLRADPFDLAPNETDDVMNVDFDPRGGLQQRKGYVAQPVNLANPNLLTAAESSSEGSLAGLAAGNANTVIALSLTAPYVGTQSVRMTAVGAGTIGLNIGERGGLGIPVNAGWEYTFFSVVFGSVNRDTRMDLYYYDGAMVQIGAAIVGPTFTQANFTFVPVTGIAPVGAVYAKGVLVVEGCGAGEHHYSDARMFSNGRNGNAYLAPGIPTNKLDAKIVSLHQHTTTLGADQILVFTSASGTGGTLWFRNRGDNNYWAIGSYRPNRGITFKDKFYMAAHPDASVSWDGHVATPLGQTWSNNLVTPNNGDMPIARTIAAWQGSVWVGGTRESGVDYPNRVRWSHPNFPEDWRDIDYIDVDTGVDGDLITGLMPLQDRLLVFKRRSIYAIVGTEPENFQVYPVSREVGAVSQDAIVATDLGIYFFSYPEGVMLYDGKGISWEFEKMMPLIENGHIPGTAQTLIYMGWSNRRLWISVPYRSNPNGAAPTWPTEIFVFDPTLSKHGAWTRYAGADIGPMMEWRPRGERSYFLGSALAGRRLLELEPPGNPQPYDDLGEGTQDHISSWYRTRWIDEGEVSRFKRWKPAEFVTRGTGTAYTLTVDTYKSYDDANLARTFTLTTPANLADHIEKGVALGQARSVMYKIKGPLSGQNQHWGLNAVTNKFIPKPVRA